jgi:ATP-dependent DNA ligase
VFDILATDRHGDVRTWPWTERRQLMLDIVGPLGPPIQPVPATDDPEVARAWCDGLRAQGVEGLVAKPAGSAYRGARI